MPCTCLNKHTHTHTGQTESVVTLIKVLTVDESLQLGPGPAPAPGPDTHIQNDTPRLLHHSVQTKVESGFKTSAQHVTQLHPVSPPSSWLLKRHIVVILYLFFYGKIVGLLLSVGGFVLVTFSTTALGLLLSLQWCNSDCSQNNNTSTEG